MSEIRHRRTIIDENCLVRLEAIGTRESIHLLWNTEDVKQIERDYPNHTTLDVLLSDDFESETNSLYIETS